MEICLHSTVFSSNSQGATTVLQLTAAPGVPFSPFIPDSPYNKTQKQHNIISKMNIIINHHQILTECIQIILTVTPFGPGAPGLPSSP